MSRNQRKQLLMCMNRDRLLDMAFGRWKVTAPPGVDPDIIEPILTIHGKGCFYNVPEIGWVFGSMTGEGLRDHNNNPETVNISLRNGRVISSVPFADVIPVYNNRRRAPIFSQICDFAWRLATLQLTIDTNIALRRFPGFVACNQKEQAVMKNLLNAWAGDDIFIMGRKDTNLKDMLQYISFGVPDTATPTDALRNRTKQDALAFLGIDSSPSEKGAQVGAAEVVSNMGEAYAMRLNYQQPRDQAARLAREKFGIEIGWEWQGLETARALLEMETDEPENENGGDFE